MSILSKLTSSTDNKLVIPCLDRMYMSNISRNNRGLAFLVNKGYFELSDLQTLLNLNDFCQEDKVDLILVGGISKVRLKSNKIVYRQRVFFQDLSKLINCCRTFGLKIIVPKQCEVTINTMLRCKEEMIYLAKYARLYGQSIDDYLLWTFKIQFHLLLQSERIFSGMQSSIEEFLEDKKGYLDRAPFIMRRFNPDKKTSSLFYIADTSDEALFSPNLKSYGYTEENRNADLKRGGVLNGN